MSRLQDSPADGVLVREFVIKNKLGVHARPAALIVKLASGYDADVQVEKAGASVSGKSIMGLLTLEAGYGCKLTISVAGLDADELLLELSALIERKFDEE